MNKTRIIDYWNSDVASRYFANVGFSIKALNNKIEIDDANNILALEEGVSTIQANVDGIKGKIDVKIEKNPVVKLKLISETNNARTGDVIDYNAIAYDKRGNVIENIKAEYSFTGKSFDKSSTASGLIL